MLRPALADPTHRARPAVAFFLAYTLLEGIANPSSDFAGISTSFYLKNRLHIGPEGLALFGVLCGVPGYFAVLVGYVRDRWSPLGLGDRGYLLVFAPVLALAEAALALEEITFGRVVAAALIIVSANLFIGTAMGAAQTTVGQRWALTGRLSSILGTVGIGLGIGLSLLGGWAAAHLAYRTVLLVLAALSLGLALLGLWRPRGFVDHVPLKTHRGLRDLRPLVRDRAFRASLLVVALWSVNPVGGILFWHLTEVVRFTPERYGAFFALVGLSTLPAQFAYGFLCTRFRLRPLLLVGLFVAVPEMLAILLLRDASGWISVALFCGASAGLGGAAIADLLMRTCPRGLEGTAMAVQGLVGTLVGVANGLLGARLYRLEGIGAVVGVSVVAAVLTVPAIFRIPQTILDRRDGEALSAVEETGAA